MISDISPTSPSFMDFMLNLRIYCLEFYDGKWIIDIHAFVNELSQVGDRRCLDQDPITLEEVIDGDAECYSECLAQIKDW